MNRGSEKTLGSEVLTLKALCDMSLPYLIFRLSVCLSVGLSVCLAVWLSDCLSGRLVVCLVACLSVWVSGCLSVCPSKYLIGRQVLVDRFEFDGR
jgi:hypothetical protein